MTTSRRRAAASRHAIRCARGFTLIEAIVVIALIGVVAVMVAIFIARPVNAFVDQARRAELGDIADTALRRATREIARALPNSVRVDTSNMVLEFLPVSATGRYRAAPAADGSGDYLELNDPNDNSFDVLGPGVNVAAGDQLVVYNLGLPGSDAYAGDNRRALTSTGSALTNLTYTVGSSQFPYPSPSARFQIVATPVTYVCAPGANGSGTLRRYSGYPIQSAQPTDPNAAPLAGLSGSGNVLMATSVEGCSFAYSAGPSARIGLVTIRLTLAGGGEHLTLVVQAHVDNSP